MTREELLTSKEYWLSEFQINLYNEIRSLILKKHGKDCEKTWMRFWLAEELNSKLYKQVRDGELNSNIEDLFELCYQLGLYPKIEFKTKQQILEEDKNDN